MMSHTFAICAYKDSPYLDVCIHSLKKQSVKSKIILCTSTPSPFLEAMAKIHDIPLYVRNGKSDIQDDWNFAYEKADTRLVTIAHQDDCYHRDYAAEVQRCWERYPDTTVFTTDCAILKGETLQKPGMIQFIKMLLRLPLRLHGLANWAVVKRQRWCLAIRSSALPVLMIKKYWVRRYLTRPTNLRWTGTPCGSWQTVRGVLPVWSGR